MDDNYIINRIISILNSQNSNLLLGNITSPRPGTICQVSTNYGIKSAYNINCTYPGNAIVVWDKDEERYYCFTNAPSKVISSKQYSYRKNRETVKVKKTAGFIWILDFNMLDTVISVSMTNLVQLFTDALKLLNIKNKTIYTLSGNFLDPFLGAFPLSYKLVNELKTKENIQIKEVTNNQLNTVDSVLWLNLPSPLGDTSTYAINITSSRISQIKTIAKLYGVIIQSEHSKLNNFPFLASWKKYNEYVIDNFYNPSNTIKLVSTDVTNRDNLILNSNYGESKGLVINNNEPILTALIPTSKLKAEQALSITSDNFTNMIYWKT
jgi:hypothetical protein